MNNWLGGQQLKRAIPAPPDDAPNWLSLKINLKK